MAGRMVSRPALGAVFSFVTWNCALASFDAVHHLAFCNERHDGSDFWTQLAAAGKEAIPMTEITCFPRHENARYEVEETVEEQIQRFEAKIDSLIALHASGQKVALLLPSHIPWWPQILRAARGGVYVLLTEYFPMDWLDWAPGEFEELMDSDDMLLTQVFPDQSMGGRFTGAELCRLYGNSPQRVALGYFSPIHPQIFHNRVDHAVEEFRERCPDTSIEVVKIVYTPDNQESTAEAGFRDAFLIDPAITAVLAGSDNLALGAVRAAEAVLGPRRAAEIAVSGFDNAQIGRQLVAEKRILNTVDQLSTRVADFGFWTSISQWMTTLGEGDWTTRRLRKFIGNAKNDTTIVTPVLGISKDPEGALFNKLVANYETAARAVPVVNPGATEVQIGLVGMNVREFFLAGSLQSTFWLRLSWKDTRLTWSELEYNKTLRWPSDTIWTPSITYTNIETPDAVIYESPVKVSPDGTVEWELNVQGSFTCDLNTVPNPFIIHECGIHLSTPADVEEVVLVPTEMHILGGPEGFGFPEVVDYTVGESAVAPGKARQELVYTFRTTKSTSFAIWAYVMSAALLNLMSFLQLYIPVADDRTGFGLTTVLAAMVLQTEARQSSVTTWLDVFLSLSFLFQFSTFLVSVAGRRTAHSQKWTEAIVVYEANYLKEASRLARVLVKVLGSDAIPSEDKWSRRLQLPVFSVICMALTFFPFGDMDITPHPEHGASCPLFWFGFLTFMPYVVLYGALPFWSSEIQEIYRKAREDADEEVLQAAPTLSPRGSTDNLEEVEKSGGGDGKPTGRAFLVPSQLEEAPPKSQSTTSPAPQVLQPDVEVVEVVTHGHVHSEV